MTSVPPHWFAVYDSLRGAVGDLGEWRVYGWHAAGIKNAKSRLTPPGLSSRPRQKRQRDGHFDLPGGASLRLPPAGFRRFTA